MKHLLGQKFNSFYTDFRFFLRRNFLVAMAFYSAVLGCDLVARFGYHINIHFEPLFLLATFGIGILLSYTNKIFAIFLTCMIFIIELIELNYTVYFGTPIDASDIMNIVRESRDVFDISYLKETGIIAMTAICLYGFLIYALICTKRCYIKGIWIILLCIAAHKPYHAIRMRHDIWYFQPSITRPTLKNSINTFSYFLFRYYPRGYQQTSLTYKTYQIHPVETKTENILLIFGESLSARHLPMFGYTRNTFPQISALLNQDTNEGNGWNYRLAISGGIATATSTLLFFNNAREPANLDLIKAQTTNLFKLAKENGFNTYYYSNQESRLTKGLGTKYIDEIITHDTHPLFFALHQDEGLIELLDKINFQEGKNFVVLHMRSPHSPYEKRYKGREAEFEKFKPTTMTSGRLIYETNTYDNALLYTDNVLIKMINHFEELAYGRQNSIYMTADHGQLFDYHGMWGHNNLVIEQAKVPFFYRMNQPKVVDTIVSHYQIGTLIAQDLGFQINNPNDDNTYFLHGNNIDFPYSFIHYSCSKEDIAELSEGNTGAPQKGE